MIKITYKKKNGDIVIRTLKYYTPYRVGDINSYGWKVENIQKEYKGKFYSLLEYNNILYKNDKRNKIISKFKKFIVQLNKFIYFLIGLIILIKIICKSVI